VRVAELWRYPVKSMAGEPLERADLRRDGIFGDRVVQVEDARGRVVTSRTRPRLLGHRATLGPDGEPLYVVNAQMIPRIKVPETLIKRQQQQIPRQERDRKGMYG